MMNDLGRDYNALESDQIGQERVPYLDSRRRSKNETRGCACDLERHLDQTITSERRHKLFRGSGGPMGQMRPEVTIEASPRRLRCRQ